MWLSSNRRWLGRVLVVAGWAVLGACNPSPVGVVDDDAGKDASLDVGTMMSEASVDANEGGAAEAAVDGGSAGDAMNDGPSDTGTQ